jgi:hypothetical protein
MAGCVTVSPEQEALADQYREQARQTLDEFERGLRQDEPRRIVQVISPELPPGYRRGMARMAAGATILTVYNGYEANTEAAVSEPGARDWLDGTVKLKLPGTNAFGDEIPERLTLVKSGERWWIANMNLAQPEPGSLVDPGPEDQQEIAQVSERVFQTLREHKVGQLLAMIPEGENTQYIYTNPSFWGRLTRGSTRITVAQVVQDVFQPLEITRWPDPLEDMTLYYVSNERLRAVYELPYNWPDDPVGGDVMELEVHVYNAAGDWKLNTVRFYGAPFLARDIRRGD